MAGVFGSARENPVTFGITERERKARYLQHKALYNKSQAKVEQFASKSNLSYAKSNQPVFITAPPYINKLTKAIAPEFAGKKIKNRMIIKQARKSGKIQKTLTALNYGQFGDYK